MYLQCDRCLKAGVTCVPDPMRLCKRCHYNKQGCSLMPVNKKTGKTDWRNLTEAEIFRFRVAQLKKKQDALGHKKPEASGSKTSLSTTLSVLALESGSSHSPPAASDSPAAATTSDSPAPLGPSSHSPPAPAAAGLPATTRVAAPREVNFTSKSLPILARVIIEPHPQRLLLRLRPPPLSPQPFQTLPIPLP